jgi:hypothetical protein
MRRTPSRGRRVESPEVSAPVTSTAGAPAIAAQPLQSAAAPPTKAAPSEAEALLRRLEPLAVTDKAHALQLALEGDARLPASGVFAEARRALIVTLLVDLDRMDEARARARSFTAEYPASGYLPLVQGVTGVHPRPRPSELRDAR